MGEAGVGRLVDPVLYRYRLFNNYASEAMDPERSRQETSIDTSQFILGSGNFGQVVKQVDRDEEFAVKRIDIKATMNQRRLKNLEREVHFMQAIKHPNIVQFKSNSEQGQFFEIKMEYCSGKNLREYLQSQEYRQECKANPTFSQQFGIKVCLQLVDAITAMRQKLIINRDIKPDNIMVLTKAGCLIIKLIDFGQVVFTTKWTTNQVGTFGYMAPEVYSCDNLGPYTDICDQWSLGITMSQIFQGLQAPRLFSSPFCSGFEPSRESFENFYLFQIKLGACISDKTPPLFRKVIFRMLEPDPSKRLTFYEMIVLLSDNFQSLLQYFNLPAEYEQYRKNLMQCQFLEKKSLFTRQMIDNSLNAIYKLFHRFFIKLNSELSPLRELQLSANQLDVVRFFLLVITKIHQHISLIAKYINSEPEIPANTLSYILQELLAPVLGKSRSDLLNVQLIFRHIILIQTGIEADNQIHNVINMTHVEKFCQKHLPLDPKFCQDFRKYL